MAVRSGSGAGRDGGGVFGGLAQEELDVLVRRAADDAGEGGVDKEVHDRRVELHGEGRGGRRVVSLSKPKFVDCLDPEDAQEAWRTSNRLNYELS